MFSTMSYLLLVPVAHILRIKCARLLKYIKTILGTRGLVFLVFIYTVVEDNSMKVNTDNLYWPNKLLTLIVILLQHATCFGIPTT
jgi:hypothetical protein